MSNRTVFFYRVHIFRESGTLEVADDATVEYALIAGGGGGGSYDYTAYRTPGGGGAGGVITGEISLVSGTYPIVVGAGGTGVVATGQRLNPPCSTQAGGTVPRRWAGPPALRIRPWASGAECPRLRDSRAGSELRSRHDSACPPPAARALAALPRERQWYILSQHKMR